METQMNPILMAEDLRKTYGYRKALRGLTFSLRGGRVLGFLGPNGAGKTTSIRILTTMMEPDAGHFTVDGIDHNHPEKIRRRIGVLPESLGFPRQITGVEYLTYFGRLYGLTAENARRNADTLLKEVGLEQRGKSLIGTYSHGMRQRVGIARALVNTPVVIFLDEPTLGLDPRGQQELLSLIQRIARERNTGVILCSHSLSEIEGICDDVVIMSSGTVVAQGEVKEILGKGNKNAFRLQVPPDSSGAAQAELEKMSMVVKAAPNSTAPGWLNIEITAPSNGSATAEYRDNNPLLQTLIQAGIPILTFEPAGNRLQDVFLQLTEEAIR
jgi:ABC-2 type transport system ATP-binding protein